MSTDNHNETPDEQPVIDGVDGYLNDLQKAVESDMTADMLPFERLIAETSGELPASVVELEGWDAFKARVESLDDLMDRKAEARTRVKALAEAGVSEEDRQIERDALKSLCKLTSKDFDALFNAVKGHSGRRNPGIPEQGDGFSYGEVFGMPEDTVTPRLYRINTSGVFVMNTESGEWTKIAYAPLVITSVFSDAQGHQSAELAWKNFDGKVVRRIVSKGILRRGRKLIEELAEVGLPVVESDSRLIERWLAEFETHNHQNLKNRYIARHLGWQPDGTFVAGPYGDTRVEVEYDDQRGPANAHRPGGSLQGWRDGVLPVSGYDVPRAAIAAAFGASLLRPLGVSSFAVDISSRSSRGKTTVLLAGLSVWADPDSDADALATWRTTLISIEKRLNLVRGIVTALDETMTVESEEIVSNVLYDLPKGVGKARSGGWPSCLQWETILLSTGERSALSYSTHQGAAARVLCITKSPFPEGSGDVVVGLREAVLENHGVAGPAFVSKLTEMLGRDGGKTLLRDRHKELTDQLKGSTDMTGRRAPLVATIVLAEQLACEWDILPYAPMPVTGWQKLFVDTDSQTDNRPEMAMEILRAHIATHGEHLFRKIGEGTRWASTEHQQPSGGWLGMVIPGKGGSPDQVALHPEKVRKILFSSGYAYDAVLEGWLEAGYLELSKSQRPAHLIPKRMGGGTRAKMLVFTPEAINMTEGTDE